MGGLEIWDKSYASVAHAEIPGYSNVRLAEQTVPESVSFSEQEFVGPGQRRYKLVFYGPLDGYTGEDQQRLKTREKPFQPPQSPV